MENLRELKKLLSYVVDHNDHHVVELTDCCPLAEELGEVRVAMILKEAAEHIRAGNEKIRTCIELIS